MFTAANEEQFSVCRSLHGTQECLWVWGLVVDDPGAVCHSTWWLKCAEEWLRSELAAA